MNEGKKKKENPIFYTYTYIYIGEDRGCEDESRINDGREEERRRGGPVVKIGR